MHAFEILDRVFLLAAVFVLGGVVDSFDVQGTITILAPIIDGPISHFPGRKLTPRVATDEAHHTVCEGLHRARVKPLPRLPASHAHRRHGLDSNCVEGGRAAL